MRFRVTRDCATPLEGNGRALHCAFRWELLVTRIGFDSALIISLTAKGDRKRALFRLRSAPSFKTHHFSTFRTGLALGLAAPAILDGTVRCKSSIILWCLLSLLQAYSPTRALPYHRGGPCFTYM